MLSRLVLALLGWRFVRHNRVSPRHPSHAPLAWNWSPRGPARLHRRLRAAMTPMVAPRPRKRSDPELHRLIGALEHDAAALDDELVEVSRYPLAARRERMELLATRTQHLEAAAHTLRVRPVPRGVELDGHAPVSVCILERDRLLRQARQELDRLELGVAATPALDRPATKRASGLAPRRSRSRSALG